MSPMLSREGLVTCQNKQYRQHVGNLESEILECHTNMLAHHWAINTSQMHFKTLAQLLEKQSLGSIWNRSVAWAAKTEKTSEKLRKYMYFAIEPIPNKTLQKLCKISARSFTFCKI